MMSLFIRRLLILLAAVMSATLLSAAGPTRDWRRVATRTPSGAYVIGNPAARAKLVEYSSYTCPHCGAFAVESGPVLMDRMIRDGSTSLEIHPVVRDRLDLAAAILARCGGAQRFAAMHLAIYAAQNQWLDRGIAFEQGNAQRLSTYALLGQLRTEADGAGLTDVARAHGLAPAAIDRCFADRSGVDALVALSAATPANVPGTPAFFLRGQLLPAYDWAKLEPLLRAQGAR